ncbi:helix-turn-helix domain-containing protein [Ostreiculturibacter nitratireducens]|uniref:TetR/AcrR family transcriptional regulator n=1 Tax=Ostreiculturibacter nitratireducens TaxID=3075226 RepID=UPI0031B56CAC
MSATATKAEPKAVEILDRIKTVFAAKGFDGASMQDLARAAGMSAGNFYRYFSSKDAIIEAIVERELALIEDEFSRIMKSANPRAALIDSIRIRVESARESDGPLWAEIEAASTRRPEIGILRARMETEIGRYLMVIFARIAGISEADAAERFGAHAALLMLIVHGLETRTCGQSQLGTPEANAALNDLVLHTVDGLLAEVAAALPVRPRTFFPKED